MSNPRDLEELFADHELAPGYEFTQLRYETRPLLLPTGGQVDDLFNAWIWLDNPEQYNCYSTRAMANWCLPCVGLQMTPGSNAWY